MVDCDSERIWKIVESYRLNVPKRRHQSDSPPTLFDRLYDCYVECNQTSSEKSADKRFRNAVNLLERLSPSHAHPSLIVNLYPDEQGYSIVLCPKKGSETEEVFLPYEDNEIFSYLDNQELPPVLVEVLGQTKHCHMYNGCVVCEVRDHRSVSCSNGSYDRHLLLLRPTTETILSTVEEMAFETGCSAEDKLFLESKLLLATQPPICLDPSTDVVCFTNRLQYNQRKFHTPAIRRTLRKRSHARRARMHMTSEGVAPRGLQLHDFITQRTRAQPRERKRDFSNCWKKAKIDHQLEDTPEAIFASVLRLTKPVTPPPLIENHSPHLRRLSATSQTRPHPQPVSRQPSVPHPLLEERESQSSLAISVPNEVPPVQGHPPHPPAAPLPPSHPHQIPLPTAPTIVEQHTQQQPSLHHLPPPPPLAPPTATPPSMVHVQLPVPVAVPPLTATTVTPPQASQPHPLTPTPPPAPLVPSVPMAPPIPASIAVPTAVSQAPPPSPPPLLQSPQQQQLPVTSQPLLTYGPGSIQLPPGLPPGITTNPDLLKLFLTQMQMQAQVAAAAAAGQVRQQKQPRPIAPAVSVTKATSTPGGGAPREQVIVVKSKSPALPVKPPPLSQAATNPMSRSGGSTMVQVSPQVRPPLLSLATPTPPSLTPSPKRPLSSLSSQNMSPGQAGMPKLHLLAQESSVQQKSSLPPQPALSKPTVPPPPLALSTSAPGGAPPPTMPTLHKISATPTPMPPHLPLQQQQQQQRATPTVGGAIPTPPLKANPNVMPKLTTSLGQRMKPTASGLPVLSRAPMTLQPPPAPMLKPHPRPHLLTHPQLSTSSSSSSGFQLKPLAKSSATSKTLTKTTASGSKHSKQSGSSGKAGKSHGSSTKKKKK